MKNNYNKILELLEQKKYSKALFMLKNMNGNDNIMRMMKAYSYYGLKQYHEGDLIEFSIMQENNIQIVSDIFRIKNDISNALKFSSTVIDQYNCYLLLKDHISAFRLSFPMKDKQFLIFSIIYKILLENCTASEKLLERYSAYLKLEDLYFLISKGKSLNLILEHMKEFNYPILTYSKDNRYYLYLIAYELLKINTDYCNIFKISLSELVQFLITMIDSYGLYEIVLRHNISIQSSMSLNFKIYTVHLQKKIFSSFSIKNIDILNRLLACPYDFTEANGEILLYYSKNISMLYRLFEEGRLKNVKYLLALLIASREYENLIRALYITFLLKEKDSSNDYRIIHTYLLRFFCLFKYAEEEYVKLKIQYIQFYDSSYILTDLIYLFKLENERFTYLYNNYKGVLHSINDTVVSFIYNGKYNDAYSLLALREKLCKSYFIEELNSNAILTENKTKILSNFLGENCAYLFNKLTKNNADKIFKYRNIYNKDGIDFEPINFPNEEFNKLQAEYKNTQLK